MSVIKKFYRRALPQKLQFKIDVARSYGIRAGRPKVVFVHVPKNAGTSIAVALYGKQIQHVPVKYTLAYKPALSSSYKFAIYRDPLHRFISAYTFAVSGGTEWVRPHTDLTLLARSCASVSTFAAALERRDLWHLDLVLQPQVEFVTSNLGELLVDDLFSMEALPTLMSELSRPARILNASKFKRREGGISLTEEALSILKGHYLADFDLARYVSPISNLQSLRVAYAAS